MNNIKIETSFRISTEDVIDALTNLNHLVLEVTDDCNLACKYCAYGDMYWGYDRRESKYMSFADAKTIIDYLVDIWRHHPTRAQKQATTIGFYGGEPLLNFRLIQQVISYVEGMGLSRYFDYTMTSNCLLLDRYMDYIAEKDIRLLCSLDGDKISDGYRVRHDGTSSFDSVFHNIKKLKERYPDFFHRKVDFNTVLHNLNSVQSVCAFFKREFDKYPRLSQISDVGIRPDKKEDFQKAFKSVSESLLEADNYEELSKAIGSRNPDEKQVLSFLEASLPGVYNDYAELFRGASCRQCIPSGTCLPFTKKMFVKVDGKILQCERIPHSFSLGRIHNGNVYLDPTDISKKFNNYLDLINDSCSKCAIKGRCNECFYQMEDIETGHPRCPSLMNEDNFHLYEHYTLEYLYHHPELYEKYINEVHLKL